MQRSDKFMLETRALHITSLLKSDMKQAAVENYSQTRLHNIVASYSLYFKKIVNLIK